ncbi:MAG: MFS transporter [Candidatus Eremiobacteraeota bacterium]|nr:MFS transporter [Candidatus Eremiobacteraeota bacterium]
MTGRWRVLTLMTTAQAGAAVVQQALGSLSPIFVTTFGLSKAQLGLMFTALMLGSALFVGAAGVMTDRWGERRILLFSGMTMTFALLAATLFTSYLWIVACIAVFGAGYAASTPAGGRAILAWFDRDRGFAMGIRQTGVPVGGLLGALTLPLVAHVWGYRGAFAFAAVIVAVTTLIAYVGYREQRDDSAPATTLASVLRGMRTLARDPRLIGVTLTCMILVSAQSGLNAFFTITGVAVVGTSAGVAALAFACAQGAAVCGRLAWGYLSDRVLHGERLIPFTAICVLAALGAAALALTHSGTVGVLFVSAIVLGLSAAGWNGLMAATISEVGGSERAASALGITLTAIFLTSSAAPIGFGALADHTSLRVAWLATAALSVVGVVPVLWLRGHLAMPRPQGR